MTAVDICSDWQSGRAETADRKPVSGLIRAKRVPLARSSLAGYSPLRGSTFCYASIAFLK